MSELPFRDVQCQNFDLWVYPEDGLTHEWRAYRMPNGEIHLDNIEYNQTRLSFIRKSMRIVLHQ